MARPVGNLLIQAKGSQIDKVSSMFDRVFFLSNKNHRKGHYATAAAASIIVIHLPITFLTEDPFLRHQPLSDWTHAYQVLINYRGDHYTFDRRGDS